MKRTLFLALALSASFIKSEIIHISALKDNEKEPNLLENDSKSD
jgi:hypothetical protein